MTLNASMPCQIRVFPTRLEMAAQVAAHAAEILKEKLAAQPLVRAVMATGDSQIAFLQRLTSDHTVDWSRIELFHLDEYVGLGEEHPASFVRYIKERIIAPTGITRYYLLDGTRDVEDVIAEANRRLQERPVDVSFVGIGENAHLAFNDPPADFETGEPFMVVTLDEACRQQQVNEGWFPKLEDVPQRAITMSIRQILKSERIVCTVPGIRKAQAVQTTLTAPISPAIPTSILRTHPNIAIFLDADSASLLEAESRK
jgi:glucosamine-6-phosphate deaminase